jgi:thioredoxin 1
VVIREKIILHSKPGAVPAYSLEGLLDRIAKMDMTQVRDEIEKSQSESESA